MTTKAKQRVVFRRLCPRNKRRTTRQVYWVHGSLNANGAGLLDATLLADTMTYLPNDLLVKVDIATMAVSLEARSPFLDHHVIEFAASLPQNLSCAV